MQRRSVDLPDPLAPARRAWRPAETVRLTRGAPAGGEALGHPRPRRPVPLTLMITHGPHQGDPVIRRTGPLDGGAENPIEGDRDQYVSKGTK